MEYCKELYFYVHFIAMDNITEPLNNNVEYCCYADDLALMAGGKMKFCKKAMQ
jgi:hypothetical protein